MRRIALLSLLFFSVFAAWAGVCIAQKSSAATPPNVPTAEDWQKEFDNLCSKTQDAMAYSIDELKTFLQRCDTLRTQIDQLDETRKKVYSRRLGQCRGLFAYVLEWKEKEKK